MHTEVESSRFDCDEIVFKFKRSTANKNSNTNKQMIFINHFCISLIFPHSKIKFMLLFSFSHRVIVLVFALQLSGSNGKEYHFKHRVLQHARTRRSIPHTRVLKREPLVCIEFHIYLHTTHT